MAVSARTRLSDAAGAFSATLRNPSLRRAQLSFGAAWTAEWAFTVAIGVVAFRDGGAAAVGLIAMLRTLPAAVLAPVIAAVADRLPRDRVMATSSLVRAAATGAAAAVLAAGGPLGAVYALAVVSTIAVTPFRAAHSALLPSLCRTPGELTSSNVVRGSLDSLALLVGPIASAGLLAVSSAAAVFAAAAALALWSAALIARVSYEAPPRPAAAPARLLADTVGGLRAAARDGDLRLLIGLGVAQTFTRGCLTVLLVVVAIDLLGTGDPGVGVLTAAIGAGAVLGSIGTTLLVGAGGLARWFGVSVAAWGAPVAGIALWPEQGPALALMGIIGAANAVVDVGLFSLMGRIARDEILARVFGALEALIALSVAAGALLTPWLIEALGLKGALVAVGTVAPASALLGWRALRDLDRRMGARDVDITLLQRIEMLRPLPVTTIERIVEQAEHVELPAGAEVVRQGDVGRRYYVIEAGEVDVSCDGEVLARLGAGDGFGEIALLRDVARTSTVRGATPLSLLAIERDDFVPAVTGFRESARSAEATVEARLRRA